MNVGSTPDVFEIRRSSLGGFEDWYYSLGIPPFNTHQTNGVRFRVVGPSPPACSNSLDDDGDGKIDSADFGCTSVSDT